MFLKSIQEEFSRDKDFLSGFMSGLLDDLSPLNYKLLSKGGQEGRVVW